MSDKQFDNWLGQKLALINRGMREALPKGSGNLAAAMRYSTLGSGKRLRPLLCMATAADFGGSKRALHAACAVELIHCYSLVHDDLPCMDDDDTRRGKPSCHAKFGEAISLLAGDGLLTLAFAQMAKSGLGDEGAVKLAQASGHAGMIGGQALDIEGNADTAGKLRTMHAKKTGGLIQLAAELGALNAPVSSAVRASISKFGKEFGLFFQIADDIQDAAEGGDTSKSKANPQTYVTVLGKDEAQRHLDAAARKVKAALERLPAGKTLLQRLCGHFFPKQLGTHET